MNKVCNKCGKDKDASEFNHQANARGGLRYSCKLCEAEYSRKWNKKNLEKARSSSRKWRKENPKKIRDNRRAWSKANPDKIREIDRKSGKRRRKLYPDKAKARNAVSGAIRSGRLVSQPCVDCGRKPEKVNSRQIIEADHYKGYNESHWLDIQWVCRTCHKGRHIGT